MGENKSDQNVDQTTSDQQQIYGSQQQGRHNREGTSQRENLPFDEEGTIPSMKQQNRLNRQDQGNEEREDDSYDYETDDEQYEQGRFSTRSQLNEMQDDNMIAKVEGDDKDILGETENSRRNQQGKGPASSQGNPQNR